MIRLSLPIAVASALLVLSTPAAAKDFAVPIALPKGATIDLVIEKTKGETRHGSAQPSGTATFRYRQTVTPQGDGYRVRQVMTGTTFPPGAQPTAAESQMLTAASEMAYAADTALRPVEVLDWPATVDRIFALIARAEPDDSNAASDQARKMFLDMGPQLAAQSMLKEQNMLAIPQMLDIDLGGALEQRQQVPNPLGGPSIDSTHRVELVSVDKGSGRAVIRTTQTLDPASASRSMKALMERVGKGSPPPGDFRLERTLACAYDMDMKTGLTAKVACDMKSVFSDAGGESFERTERTVITQTLVSQP